MNPVSISYFNFHQLYRRNVSEWYNLVTLLHLDQEFKCDDHHDTNDRSILKLFNCPEVGFIKQFVKHGQPWNHLATSKHIINRAKLSLLDTAKSLYQRKLEFTLIQKVSSLRDLVVTQQVPCFWFVYSYLALPFSFRNRFQEKIFVSLGFVSTQNKIQIDKSSSSKINIMKESSKTWRSTSIDVAHEMEVLKKGNEYAFEPDPLLNKKVLLHTY